MKKKTQLMKTNRRIDSSIQEEVYSCKQGSKIRVIPNQQSNFTIQGTKEGRTNHTQSWQKEGNDKDYSRDKLTRQQKSNREN